MLPSLTAKEMFLETRCSPKVLQTSMASITVLIVAKIHQESRLIYRGDGFRSKTPKFRRFYQKMKPTPPLQTNESTQRQCVTRLIAQIQFAAIHGLNTQCFYVFSHQIFSHHGTESHTIQIEQHKARGF
jgi:hypothetical protein